MKLSVERIGEIYGIPKPTLRELNEIVEMRKHQREMEQRLFASLCIPAKLLRNPNH
jgi:hypothetical protein